MGCVQFKFLTHTCNGVYVTRFDEAIVGSLFSVQTLKLLGSRIPKHEATIFKMLSRPIADTVEDQRSKFVSNRVLPQCMVDVERGRT